MSSTDIEKLEQAPPPAQYTAPRVFGASTDQEDLVQSFVGVLQALSPQVNKRNPAYVDGAEPGMFYCQNLGLLVPGEVGVVLQQFAYSRAYVEWVPRDLGGGFVDRYEELPEGVSEISFGKWRHGDNEILQTRYHFCNLYDEGHPHQIIVGMKSTMNAASRQWNGQQIEPSRHVMKEQLEAWNKTGSSIKLRPTDIAAPAHLWRMRTREQSNAKGTWFNLYTTYERPATPDEFVPAFDMFIKFQGSALRRMGAELPDDMAGDKIPY